MTSRLLQLIAEQHVTEIEHATARARPARDIETGRCAPCHSNSDGCTSTRLARLRCRLTPARVCEC